jgi:hypothetical protein
MKRILLLPICSLLLFTSCNTNNTSNTAPFINYEAYSTLIITNAVPGIYTFQTSMSNQSIQILPGNSSGIFTNDTFTYETDATNGYMPYTTNLHFTPDIAGCADIEIQTFFNGVLFNTDSFQIGYSSFSPNIACDNTIANNYFIKTINLPYQ